MGICTSAGIIRDFAGPYFVSVSHLVMLFLASLAQPDSYTSRQMLTGAVGREGEGAGRESGKVLYIELSQCLV